MKLLIGLTGSISVLGVPAYLISLREKFDHVKVIMTESAQQFIPKDSIALLVDQVHTQMFPIIHPEMSHAQLAQWADLFIVLPATAHTIAQVALGLAGSLLTATILAYQRPVIFFPNMNEAMWANPTTQRNVKQLEEHGHLVILPSKREGYEHASGNKTMNGHMPPPHEIMDILEVEIEKQKIAGENTFFHSYH